MDEYTDVEFMVETMKLAEQRPLSKNKEVLVNQTANAILKFGLKAFFDKFDVYFLQELVKDVNLECNTASRNLLIEALITQIPAVKRTTKNRKRKAPKKSKQELKRSSKKQKNSSEKKGNFTIYKSMTAEPVSIKTAKKAKNLSCKLNYCIICEKGTPPMLQVEYYSWY